VSDSDRVLLELAAKAAGFVRMEYRGNTPYVSNDLDGDNFTDWNPLTDSGDALRLAVSIGFDITVMKNYAIYTHAELCAATRRAIVRAAAEIGKSMP